MHGIMAFLMLFLLRAYLCVYWPLLQDEAYYWAWSWRLDWSYYDHPPMVAVMIWVGTHLFGHSLLGVRFFFIALAALACVLLLRLLYLRALYLKASYEQALEYLNQSAWIMGTVPLFFLGANVATPDLVQFFTLSATLYALCFAIFFKPEKKRYWLYGGFFLGLSLLSKYTSILIALSVFIYLLCSSVYRFYLRSCWPYLGCILACVVFFPVLFWNIKHDFASFKFQFGHAFFAMPHFVLQYTLELLSAQILLMNPIFLSLGVAHVWQSLKCHNKQELDRFLAYLFVLPLLLFIYVSFSKRIEANWLLPCYVSFLVLAPFFANPSQSVVRWFKIGVGLSLFVDVLVLLIVLFFLEWVPVNHEIVTAHLQQEMAQDVLRTWQSLEPKPYLAANRYQDASVLDFYCVNNVECNKFKTNRDAFVFSLNIQSRANQYDYWPNWQSQINKYPHLLLVAPVHSPAIAYMQSYFKKSRLIFVLNKKTKAGVSLERALWLFENE